MAKKTSKPAKALSKSVSTPAAAPAIASTVSRNSPIPRLTPAKREIEVTQDMIARRAFEIHVGGTGGSQDDNWFRAERELRSGN